MKLFVNAEEKNGFDFVDQKLMDFLGFVSKTLVPPGEIISEVKLDGEVISREMEEKNISASTCVEVKTQNTKVLLVSGILEAHRIFTTFKERLESMSDDLDASNHEKFFKDLAGCVENLLWFYTLCSGVERLLGVTFEETSTREKFMTHLKSLKSILANLLKGLQDENFILVSDILRYELQPCVSELQEFFSSLIKSMDNKFLSLS